MADGPKLTVKSIKKGGSPQEVKVVSKLKAKVVNFTVDGNALLVGMIKAGLKDGVTEDWRAHVLKGASDDPLTEDFPITKVTSDGCTGRLNGWTYDAVGSNLTALVFAPWVDPLKAPPKPPRSVKAKIVNLTVDGDFLLVDVQKGFNAGIDPNWQGRILRGHTDQMMGPVFTVDSVKGPNSSRFQAKGIGVDGVGENTTMLIWPLDEMPNDNDIQDGTSVAALPKS
jgi:hypothetical protein